MAKNCSKRPKNWKLWILALPDVDFTKIAKSSLFDCYFWHFQAIFGKTTSSSSPKQDILDLWQKHVWLYHISIFWTPPDPNTYVWLCNFFLIRRTILRKARRTTSFDFLLYGLTVKNLRGIGILVYYMYVG